MPTPLSRRVSRPWLLLPLVLLFGACAGDDAADDDMADDGMAGDSPVTSLTTAYQEHYNAGHADMIADLFTEDGVGLYADGTVARGAAELTAFTAGQMEAGNPQAQIDVLEEMMFGDTAVAVGSWDVTASPEGAEMTESSGHWMAAYVNTADGWKIAGVITNYDRQMSAEYLQGTPPTSPPPAASMMGELIDAYEAAWNAGDSEAVADLYADDAWAAFSDLPAVSGQDAIADVMEQRVRGTIAITGVQSADLGDGWAVDGGTWELSGQGVEGGPLRGHYWILVHTEDGERKIKWSVTNGRPTSVIPAAAGA